MLICTVTAAASMIIMAANAAGIAGGQVFRTQDAPLYIHAFTAMLCLSAVCLVTVIAQMAWYFWSNREMAKRGTAPIVQGRSAEGVEMKQTWWWTW